MDSQIFEELIVLCKENHREDLVSYLESVEEIIVEDQDYSPTPKEKRQFKKDQEIDMIEEGEPEHLIVVKDKDGFLSLK
jgi:hypothetical protein